MPVSEAKQFEPPTTEELELETSLKQAITVVLLMHVGLIPYGPTLRVVRKVAQELILILPHMKN